MIDYALSCPANSLVESKAEGGTRQASATCGAADPQEGAGKQHSSGGRENTSVGLSRHTQPFEQQASTAGRSRHPLQICAVAEVALEIHSLSATVRTISLSRDTCEHF